MAELFTLSLLVLAGVFFWTERSFISDMKLADGHVIAVSGEGHERWGGRQYTANVTALVAYSFDGEDYSVRSRFFGIPPWRLGETVSVYVSPIEPTKARLSRVDDAYLVTLIFSLWFVLCAVAIFVGRALGSRRNAGSKNRVV